MLLTLFICLAVVDLALFLYCVEEALPVAGLALAGLTLVVLTVLGIPVWTWCWAHPQHLMLGALGYIIIGVLWSFFKWDRWCAALKAEGVTQAPRVNWESDRICTWMAFWPFSMFWSAIRDGVLKLFTNLFRFFKSVYQRIANRHFPEGGRK